MTSVSSLLIFSDKELRSLGLVWAAHALRPGIGKVGNNLINRGCIVSFGQFKSYLSQHQDANQQAVPHSTQAEGKNNAAPRLPHLHILVVSNTFLFPMGWHEQSECQPALPKPGNSLGEAFGSASCQVTQRNVRAGTCMCMQTQPSPATTSSPTSDIHYLSCWEHLLSTPGRSQLSDPPPRRHCLLTHQQQGCRHLAAPMGTYPLPTYRLKGTLAV